MQFHLVTADEVGLSGTDYQATNLLALDGPLSSGELAARLGLTTGATTRLIDRLERAGYLRRVHDPADRRRVMVEQTGVVPEDLKHHLAAVRGPIKAVLDGLTAKQREGVLAYLEGSTAAYCEATASVRGA